MKAIKLVTGVTPKCWRPPYGDVDDRIRAIAAALGLETVIWQYDSNDWQVGSTNVTSQQVDTNYQTLIQNVQSGTFNTVFLPVHLKLDQFSDYLNKIFSKVQSCLRMS